MHRLALIALFEERVVRDEGGQITGLRVIVQDISERKMMEAELKQARDTAIESAQLKSEFMTNVGHEIRTPMNVVVGMTGLLLDTKLTGEQKEYAEGIRSSTDSLLNLVNNVLDLSRIDKGELGFDSLDFNLRTVVEETIELFAEQAEKKGVRLASVVYSDVPALLHGDPGRLRQVLGNLVDNAVKFTGHGEVMVRVTKEETIPESGRSADQEEQAAPQDMIRFTVSDTGIGISEDTQQRLFNAFTQVDGSATRRHAGAGLSLAISKDLVELMGGQIGANSKSGEGASFWFTVPGKLPFSASQRTDLHGLRVLIAGDHAADRDQLMQQASSIEMLPNEAKDEKQVLDMLRSAAQWGEPYNIAILDVLATGIDGFELARSIKADPAIASVRLMLLSSQDYWANGRMVSDTGIGAYLTKPVTQSRLFDCLLGMMNGEVAILPPLPASVRPAVQRKPVAGVALPAQGRILIVEDNTANQKVALRQIAKLGYQADAVANGLEALEALARHPYALVLMDCQMPEMDGLTATAEIRRREGHTRHTPIIALTANARRGEREKCLEAGMDDYLAKPVKVEDLENALTRWLTADYAAQTVAV
jgi:signal transduction histidine kinase/DNA-binding response OmpR family regulator